MKIPNYDRSVSSGRDGAVESRAQLDVLGRASVTDQNGGRCSQLKVGPNRIEFERIDAD